MYLKQNPAGQRSRGFSLPVAVFIVVILSLVALAVNRLSETGARSYVKTLLSTRAFYAAESGLQLTLPEVLNTVSCSCAGVADIQFTVAGLSGCQAEINCDDSLLVAGERYCQIESRGRCQGDEAQRTLEVRVK
ncbi:hypothetical protein [Bacterioplanoides pacificum]|uniref:MSHA biogenesis protein MshP n=1 Tax=Bacterioplanoides pacificum TaxID=1171596 RepID=A0ABV7VN68_9GAMM